MPNRLSSTPEWVARSPAVAACIQCGRTPTPAAAAAVVTARALAIPRAHPWDFNSIYQHVVRARHIPAARSVHSSRVYAQRGGSDDSRTGRALPLEAVTQPDLGIAAIMASIMRGDRPYDPQRGAAAQLQQQQRQPGLRAPLDEAGTPQAPDAAGDTVLRGEDLVDALQTLATAPDAVPDAAGLSEVMQMAAAGGVLAQLSAAQQAAAAQALAAMVSDAGTGLPAELLRPLLEAAAPRLRECGVRELGSWGWALLRLVPVHDAESAATAGLDNAWLSSWEAAAAAALNAPLLPVPGADPPSPVSLCNLLLLPAAARRQQQAAGFQASLEAALCGAERQLCGAVVAQALSCYVRLRLHLGEALWAAMLRHLSEDVLLYDHDDLTQVAVATASLDMPMPRGVLADMTARAKALEAAGEATPEDVQLFAAAMDHLARSTAAT